MLYIFEVFQKIVNIADQTVFGREKLSRISLDLRTLLCFVVFVFGLFIGLGVVSFLESELAEFVVWVVVSVPTVFVFLARHQRLESLK